MKHLTDEQLSARLDGELPAKPAAAVESHLAACAECRERLAALAGSDERLGKALERDPGEKYFESFAGRVSARITAAAAAGAPRPAHADAPATSRAGWLARPSTLAWAGAATALVAVGAFAIQFATQQLAGGRTSAERRSIIGADQRAAAQAPATPPPAAPAPAAEAPAPVATTPAPDVAQVPSDGESDALSALREQDRQRSTPAREEQPAKAANEATLLKEAEGSRDAKVRSRENAPAVPQRAQEVRTLPGGEQVLVPSRPMPKSEKQKTFAPPPADPSKITKPMALPLTPVVTEKRVVAPAESQDRGGRADELKLAPPAAAPAPAPVEASGKVAQPDQAASGAVLADRDESAAETTLCGTVTDPAGRALANATVTVVETGRSVSTGADGGYCVEAPAARATLSVMSVGFHEYRASVRPGEGDGPLAVALRPVQTLGAGGAPIARFKASSPPVTQGEAPATEAPAWGSGAAQLKDQPRAAKLATIAPLPGETPDAKVAREASETAMRMRTVPLWTRAGVLWEGVAVAAKTDAAANEARYRAAEARVNAWRLARGSSNRRAAAEAMDAFLARAPAGAQREQVEKWRKELPDR